MSADQLVRQAALMQRQGRLSEALPLYRQALALDPNHAEALTLAGDALTQAGQIQAALQLLQRAVQIKPTSAEAFSNLGAAWRRGGRRGDAIAAFERALSLNPRLADAQVGYGNVLLEQGDLDKALERFDAAIDSQPHNALAQCNRGAVLQMLQRPNEALDAFDRAIELAPRMAEAHANRANVLRELGRNEEAIASCDVALELRPGYVSALIFRAYALVELDRVQQALTNFDEAQRTNPDDVRILVGRGRALVAQAKWHDAIACFDLALSRTPNDARAHFYRALALSELQRRQEALSGVSEALYIEARLPGAHLFRGNTLTQIGEREAALADYESEYRINPAGADVAGHLLHAKAMLCDWEGRNELVAEVHTWIDAGVRTAYPFVLLGVTDDPATQRKCAEVYAKALRPARVETRMKTASVGGRIKLGYFSSDYCDHPVAHLMQAPFATHDRERFEVYAYSFGSRVDEYTARVRQSVDQFIDCQGFTPGQIAAHARASGIDIAIDLNGYSNGARTAIFAARAAPVQMNYIGFVGSMGADFVDYIIVDEHVAPSKFREAYAEKLLYLPLYQCNSEPPPAGEAPDRARYGLSEDAFVFSSFNSPFKATPEMFAVWMCILQRAPESVLWFYAQDAATRRNLITEAGRHGVGADRIVFADGAPRAEHLLRQRAADLALDTFPYNGGVTTSSALRAGVPVLTLAGRAFASRMGVSLLNAVGAVELVTESEQAYEDLAVELALDRNRSKALRARILAANAAQLFDTFRFTRTLEKGFASAIERYRAGRAPSDIVVH